MPPTPESSQPADPDYAELVKFLVGPFLTSQDSLRLDCEVSPRTGRILLRLAIEGEDKGKVFGRGGRNLQAIRAVVQASAQIVGRLVHLEVYGQAERDSGSGEPEKRRRSPSRPAPRPRLKQG